MWFVLLCWWCLALLVVVPVMMLAGGAVMAVRLLVRALRSAIDVLEGRPGAAHAAGIVAPPAAQSDAAYETYFLSRQILLDLRCTLRAQWSDGSRLVAQRLWPQARWLLTGESSVFSGLTRLDESALRYTRPLGIGAAMAIIAGVAGAAAAGAAIALVFAALLALVAGTMCVVMVAARTAERGVLRLRRIYMRCPYPGCYRAISLPEYACPGCGRQHQRLRPGRHGVLWRVCACDHRLPTTLLMRRHRLSGYCPGCHRPLPHGLGSTPLLHVPIIGGSGAGKSTLLVAMVSAVERLMADGRVTLEFASETSRQEFEAAKKLLISGGTVRATQERVPQAFLITVGLPRRVRRRRRLVYLYDPAGEIFESADDIRDQRYLATAGGLILVVDPFASPAGRRLTGPDAEIACSAGASREDPDATYSRVREELRAVLAWRRRRTPIAVIITKLDAVERTAEPALARKGEDPVKWLSKIGLGNLVRMLDHDCATVRYWNTSPQADAAARPGDRQRHRVADPLCWLLWRMSAAALISARRN